MSRNGFCAIEPPVKLGKKMGGLIVRVGNQTAGDQEQRGKSIFKGKINLSPWSFVPDGWHLLSYLLISSKVTVESKLDSNL